MMRTTFTKTTLLALLLASACSFALSGGALADTGGVSSPPGARPASSLTVRKAALATWFGPGFYGQRTACGQTLTPAVVGVANRTLPCGTLVKVSYKGRRLTLPVIDRGPYGHNGADWDLTTEAAHALGMEDTARIGARVVGSVPNTPTLGQPPGSPTVAATGGAGAG
ncbi:MAG: septal ring lytic transglycosylase RlpA family protein [Solirubrobacterales bacterium]